MAFPDDIHPTVWRGAEVAKGQSNVLSTELTRESASWSGVEAIHTDKTLPEKHFTSGRNVSS